jgi:hypothetical protein
MGSAFGWTVAIFAGFWLCLPKTPSAPTKHFVTMLHALTVVSSHRRTSDLDVES